MIPSDIFGELEPSTNGLAADALLARNRACGGAVSRLCDRCLQTSRNTECVHLGEILAGTTLWSGGAAVQTSPTTLPVTLLALNITFPRTFFVTDCVFLFAPSSAGRKQWLVPRRVAALGAFHALSVTILVATVVRWGLRIGYVSGRTRAAVTTSRVDRHRRDDRNRDPQAPNRSAQLVSDDHRVGE